MNTRLLGESGRYYSTVSFAGNEENSSHPLYKHEPQPNFSTDHWGRNLCADCSMTSQPLCSPMTDAALGLHLLILILGFAKLQLCQRQGTHEPAHTGEAFPQPALVFCISFQPHSYCRSGLYLPTALPWPPTAVTQPWQHLTRPGISWAFIPQSPQQQPARKSSPGKNPFVAYTVMWWPNRLNLQWWLFPRNINI